MTAVLPPAEEAAPEPARRRVERPTVPTPPWWRTDVALTACLALAFQSALTVFGALAERAFAPLQQLSTGSPVPQPSLLQHTARWDSGFFAGIQQGMYASEPQSQAFYPLFPLLSRTVEFLGGGALGHLAAGLLLNTASTWLVLLALLRITRSVAGPEASAWWAPVALLTAPTAFFLHAYYSEASFMALGFAAYLFALNRRWPLMGMCLIPLTASRITAVLFLGLCFLEFWRAHDWSVRRMLRPALLWFPASLAGFGAYMAYLKVTLGDPLGMFHAYDVSTSWSYHVFDPNIVATLVSEIGTVATAVLTDEGINHFTVADHILPLIGLGVLLAASVYLLVVLGRAGIPLGVFGFASIVMFTLNSNLVSVHRYLLPCLGIYVAFVVLHDRTRAARPFLYAGVYVSVLVQAGLMALFVANFWAG